MVVDISHPDKKSIDFHHVYQPIIDLTSKNIYGYEVLLRAENFSSPETFFQYAKDQNALFDLDMSSIEKACNTDYKIFGEALLFINVFPSTLIHPEFISRMQKIEEASTFVSKQIVFEISEAERKHDFELLSDVVDTLKKEGYLIALDDIGKGDATLRSIFEYEPDIIKFDRFFAGTLNCSEKSQRYMSKIIQVFGEDLSIVLEGLETEEEVKIAESIGTPYVQGYYLGKPKPADFYKNK